MCLSVPLSQKLPCNRMGNCLCGVDAGANTNHNVAYSEVPKYAATHPLGNQVNNSTEQKRSSHSSSPERRRLGPRDAMLVQTDQQEQQSAEQQWRSPQAVDHVPEPVQQEEPDPPEVPFSWTKGELIGIGAFGRVFSALNNVTGELVAVKQVSFAKDEALQGRVAEHIKALEAEVEVLKTLKHENIVRYLGTERTEDSLHIFLEYVPGGSIASLLAKFGPFPESVIKMYTAQLLRGLEYLHQKGIMHRDIKGANILIDKHGTVKLADFGASKKIEDLATVGSGSKSIRGTPYWMAPEVIKQTGHGRPADIWSLACTVIEMATGKPPWSTYTAPVAAMFQIASSKDPPPLPDHLSREAKDFLLLCFNRVARDRANASRLLKHPFVADVQLQQPSPFPGTPGSSAMSSSSSPAAAGGLHGVTPGRALAGPSSAVTGASRADQLQQLRHNTPRGSRQNLMANGQRTPMAAAAAAAASAAASAAAAAQTATVKAAKQSSGSPTHVQSRSSPQQQNPGDGAVIVTVNRSLVPLQQQQSMQQSQQHKNPAAVRFKLDQQQQHVPQPFDTYRMPHQQQREQEQQQEQQQQQSSSSISSSPESVAGDQLQDGHMTLVNWNPVQEPSWLPPYQPAPMQAASQQPQQPQQPLKQWQQQQKPDQGSDGAPSKGLAHQALSGQQQQLQPYTDAHKAIRSSSQNKGVTKGNPITAAVLLGKHAALPTSSSMNGITTSNSRGTGSSKRAADAVTSSVAAGPLSKGLPGRASSAVHPGPLAAAAGNGVLCAAKTRDRQGQPAQIGPISTARSQSATTAAAGTASNGSNIQSNVPTSGATGNAADQLLSGGALLPVDSDDVAMSSKRAQWENELYEELEQHRRKQRATRAAGQSARVLAMQRL